MSGPAQVLLRCKNKNNGKSASMEKIAAASGPLSSIPAASHIVSSSNYGVNQSDPWDLLTRRPKGRRDETMNEKSTIPPYDNTNVQWFCPTVSSMRIALRLKVHTSITGQLDCHSDYKCQLCPGMKCEIPSLSPIRLL
eukprot:5257550-Amphidinium_carterae.1